MKSTLFAMTAIALALAGCNAKTDDATTTPAAADTTSPAEPAPLAAVAAAPSPAPAPAPAPQVAQRRAAPSYAYVPPVVAPGDQDFDDSPPPIYTDYEPAISQPPPIAVQWAPPPLLVEAPPPQPSADARWTGGYWVWHERWAWAPGRWAEPPRPRYHWVPPYYEHRRDRVIFVDGFWAPPQERFVPPPSTLVIALAVVGAGVGVMHFHAPVGPEGIFIPPPPGSRRGLIVPAPLGTAPAVMTGAPPIIAPGMRVTNRIGPVTNNRNVENKTTINNRNTTIVNNITQVTIEAPAGSTVNHRAVNVSVPAQAHLAAALPPVEKARLIGVGEPTPNGNAREERPRPGERPGTAPSRMPPGAPAAGNAPPRPGTPPMAQAPEPRGNANIAPPPGQRRPDERGGSRDDRSRAPAASPAPALPRREERVAPPPAAQPAPPPPSKATQPPRRGEPSRGQEHLAPTPAQAARPGIPTPQHAGDGVRVESLPHAEAARPAPEHPARVQPAEGKPEAKPPQGRAPEVRPQGRPTASPVDKAAVEKATAEKATAEKAAAARKGKTDEAKKPGDPRKDREREKDETR